MLSALTCAGGSPPPPPPRTLPLVHTPHPLMGVPLPVPSAAPSGGGAGSGADTSSPEISARALAGLSRSPSPAAAPPPSSGRTAALGSRPPGKPTQLPHGLAGCSSGKGRARALSGNDVICKARCTRFLASPPRPHPFQFSLSILCLALINWPRTQQTQQDNPCLGQMG